MSDRVKDRTNSTVSFGTETSLQDSLLSMKNAADSEQNNGDSQKNVAETGVNFSEEVQVTAEKMNKNTNGVPPAPRVKPKGFHEMPYELLDYLYTFLSREELVKMQQVSQRYAKATQNVRVWKHAPYFVTDDDCITDLIKELAKMPFLHTISGYYCNTEELLNEVSTHLVDLRKMDVKFSTPISSVEIEKLLKEFKHLESITLDCRGALNILNSLRLLSYCPTLIELKIFNTERCADVYRVITAGFPALEELEINGFLPCKEMLHMFDKKKNQLKSIRFKDENSKLNSEIMESVFACSRLQSLELRGVSASLNSPEFQNLRFLKYLSMTVGNVCDPFSRVMFPSCIETLSISFWDYGPFNVGVVRKVVNQLPNLKDLELANVPDMDIDEQLSCIGSLQNLETLVLLNCRNMTERSIESITNCLNMRRLCFHKLAISRESLLRLRRCTRLKEIVLFQCMLKLEGLEMVILPLKYLTDFYLYDCNEDTDSIGFKGLKDIVKKCRSNHHSVNLTCDFPSNRFIT